METLVFEAPDKEKARALKAVAKALGVPMSNGKARKNGSGKKKGKEESPYSPEFVAMIKQGERDIAEGNYKVIKIEDLWK